MLFGCVESVWRVGDFGVAPCEEGKRIELWLLKNCAFAGRGRENSYLAYFVVLQEYALPCLFVFVVVG